MDEGRPGAADAGAGRVGADERGEQFVLYTNRHTFLTTAGADARVSKFVLKDIGGHTDLRTTDRYVHLNHQVVAEAGRLVADGLTGRQPRHHPADLGLHLGPGRGSTPGRSLSIHARMSRTATRQVPPSWSRATRRR